MPEIKVPLVKGDKISTDTDYRDALPVNMFTAPRAILDSPAYMLCHPGLTQRFAGKGVDRGGFFNDRFQAHYRVSGTKLIKLTQLPLTGSPALNPDGTPALNPNGSPMLNPVEYEGVLGVEELGTISGTGQAAMPCSFNTQAVITDGRMWLYDPTTGFREVTDVDLGDPIDGVWTNGRYFLTDGEYIYHTDLADESSIDPLKFATAEFMPDRSLGVAKTQDNKVIVFGRYSIEYFVDAVTADFAYTRIESRAQKIGIVSTHAKTELAGSYFIVGSRREESLGVYQVNIGQAVKVSTREIDKILAQYNDYDLADIRLETRVEDNLAVILIHLPNECIYYSPTVSEHLGVSNAWSILQTGYEGTAMPYRGINGVYDAYQGKWIYGDKYANYIGELDNTVFSQYDETQEWYLFSPFINMETMSIDELEAETIPGHTGDKDAKVAVATTYDGINYSMEEWVMYGEPLKYNQRFKLYRLGYVDDWIGFRLRAATKSRMAFAMLSVTYG